MDDKRQMIEPKKTKIFDTVLCSTSFGIRLLAKLDGRTRGGLLDFLVSKTLAKKGISMDELDEMMFQAEKDKEERAAAREDVRKTG